MREWFTQERLLHSWKSLIQFFVEIGWIWDVSLSLLFTLPCICVSLGLCPCAFSQPELLNSVLSTRLPQGFFPNGSELMIRRGHA